MIKICEICGEELLFPKLQRYCARCTMRILADTIERLGERRRGG